MPATATRLALVLLFLGSACGGGDSGDSEPAEGTEIEVRAVDFSFEPTSLSAAPGSDVVVQFTNNGGVQHSFSIRDIGFELDAAPGKTLSDSLALPSDSETIEFFCKYHSDQMRGTIALTSGAGGGGPSPAGEGTESDGGYDY